MEINYENFNPKKSLVLYGLEDKLNILINLINTDKFPQILLLSGKKGIGKFTLVNHFLTYFFDKNNYLRKDQTIINTSIFYKQNMNETFSNIIYLPAFKFNGVKVDNIRSLKSQLLKSSFVKQKRFVILDDVELFNRNSLNALLKIIEEPPKNNFFILINNKSTSLIETIHSRSLEFKIFIDNLQREKIIKSLVSKFSLDVCIDYKKINITPGNFLIFNYICEKNKIDTDSNIVDNIEKIITAYKKNKDPYLIEIAMFLIDIHFNNYQNENKDIPIDKIIKNKVYFSSSLKNFVKLNLNQNTFINSLNEKLQNG